MKPLIIRFKSNPENWKKECLGLKNNTIRRIDSDERFELLDKFMDLGITLLIEIENTITGDVFGRMVTDVTKFEDYYIISWKCV